MVGVCSMYAEWVLCAVSLLTMLAIIQAGPLSRRGGRPDALPSRGEKGSSGQLIAMPDPIVSELDLARVRRNEGRPLPCRGLTCDEFRSMETTMRDIQYAVAIRRGQKPIDSTRTTSLIGDIALTNTQARALLTLISPDHGDDNLRRKSTERDETVRNSRRRQKRKAISEFFADGEKWNRTIPYTIDERAFRVSSFEHNAILNGLQQWSARTCLQFIQVENGFAGPHLYFQRENSGCWSYIGRQTFAGKQPVNLGGFCAYVPGVVIHEIGHALGLVHEHTRPDRDIYVNVIAENIRQGKEHNFWQYLPFEVMTDGIAYDYGSIMHYGGTDFLCWDYTCRGQHTLETWDSSYMNVIGQRSAATFFDLKAVYMAYQCAAHLDDVCQDSVCANDGFLDTNSADCNCVCPEGLGGSRCDGPAPNSAGCLPDKNVTVTSATTEVCLTSPNYDENSPETEENWYRNRDQCNWIVQAPRGRKLTYSFKGPFHVVYYGNIDSTCAHWVEIKDSHDLSLRGKRYCGSSAPEFPDGHLTSKTDRVVVHFSAEYYDGRGAYAGSGFQVCFQLSQEKSACSENECVHGKCMETGAGAYTCQCDDGWAGQYCESDVNDCSDTPCGEHGFCIDYGASKFFCVCQANWSGQFCEEDLLDDCRSGPCEHHGVCIDGDQRYVCDCNGTGYTGPNCQWSADDVSSVCAVSAPCGHHGTCIDIGTGIPVCVCGHGWTGRNCDLEM